MMEQTLKKLSWYMFITMVVVVLIGIAIIFKDSIPKTLGGAQPDQQWWNGNVLGTKANPFAFASTTSMTTTMIATSTVGADFIYDNLSLDIKIVNASSTKASALTITPSYSNDINCNVGSATDTTIDWFTPTDVGSTNQEATTTVGAVSVTTRYKYTITELATRCVRFVFTETNASSTAWVDGLLK